MVKWIWLGICMVAGNAWAGVVDEVPMFKLSHGKQKPFTLLSETEYVAYYFSASWCPPCRKTTPPLVKEYRKMLEADERSVEIVLVGADRSEDDMLRYMEKYEMKWPAVKWGNVQLLDDYAAAGIPHLVIVKRRTGKVVASGTGPSDIEEVVKEMRVYSGVDGDFQIGTWMERYGLLVTVFACGIAILILKKMREKRNRE